MTSGLSVAFRLIAFGLTRSPMFLLGRLNLESKERPRMKKELAYTDWHVLVASNRYLISSAIRESSCLLGLCGCVYPRFAA